MRFGWLYRLKPQLQLGVMLQTPGIPLKQRVDTVSQGFVNVPGDSTTPPVTNAYFSDARVEANLPLPGELEAGLEYWPAERVMLAIDASMNSPVRSQRRVNTAAMVPVGGLYFDQDTARRFIGNVAVAGDFFINKKVMIETGFFTDLSSAQEHSGESHPLPEPADQSFRRDGISRAQRCGGCSLGGLDLHLR